MRNIISDGFIRFAFWLSFEILVCALLLLFYVLIIKNNQNLKNVRKYK